MGNTMVDVPEVQSVETLPIYDASIENLAAKLSSFPGKLDHGKLLDRAEQGRQVDHYSARALWYKLKEEGIYPEGATYREIYSRLDGETSGFSGKYLDSTPDRFFEEIDKVQQELKVNPDKLGIMMARRFSYGGNNVNSILTSSPEDLLKRKEADIAYLKICEKVYNRLLELGYNEQDLQRG